MNGGVKMKISNVNKLVRVFSDLLIVVIVSAVFLIGFSYKSVMPIISTGANEPIYRGNSKEKYGNFLVYISFVSWFPSGSIHTRNGVCTVPSSPARAG